MASFDDIVLPARCSCGEETIFASLGQLAAGPVDIECPKCGMTHRLSVQDHASRFRSALAERMGEDEVDACSIVVEPRSH